MILYFLFMICHRIDICVTMSVVNYFVDNCFYVFQVVTAVEMDMYWTPVAMKLKESSAPDGAVVKTDFVAIICSLVLLHSVMPLGAKISIEASARRSELLLLQKLMQRTVFMDQRNKQFDVVRSFKAGIAGNRHA